MNIGFYSCIVVVPCFMLMALIFGIMKEKGAKLISGFNGLSKEEQDLYDKARMVKDMRNSLVLWTVIMLIGAVGSYFITGYFAVAAYVIWLVLFFKDVHIDEKKAFAKYLLK